MSAATDFLALVLRGISTLVAIHPTTGSITGLAVDRDSLTEADTWLTLHRDCNLYFTPNEVSGRVNKKPKKADITRLFYVHLDLDDPSDAALERLRNYRLPPTFIIFSGGGYQAFWEIVDPPLINGGAEHLEAANKRAIGDLGGDPSTWNLDRVMRLPGTTNWPTAKKLTKGRVPIEARLIEHHPERRCKLADFGAPVPPAYAAPAKKPRDKSESARLYRAIYADVEDDDDIRYAELKKKYWDHPHLGEMNDVERERQIVRCAEKAREYIAATAAAALTEMNALHAVVNWKGRTLILSEPRDPDTGWLELELASPREKHNWYKNAPYVRAKNRFDWWFKHRDRRQYKGVVFAPKREVPGYHNLWKGFAVEPRPGDCSMFTTMIRDVICCGNADHFHYVTAWCADAVQNPDRRPGVVLVLRGGEGVGKGTLFRALGAVFGDHFRHVFQSRHVVGHFNALLAYTLFLFADEAIYAGDKQAEGALQGLITEPLLVLEMKGKDPVSVKNLIRVGMASNQDWVVPAGTGGRRYAVFDVSDAHRGDFGYWNLVNHELDNGGREAWLHDLLAFDLTGIDLRKIPETQARMEQVLRSLDAIPKWWFGRLWAGAPTSDADEWSSEVITDDMYRDYVNETGITGKKFRAVQTELGMALAKYAPGYTVKRQWRSAVKKRVPVSRLPPLAECREAFAKKFRLENLDWPKESAADALDPNAL